MFLHKYDLSGRNILHIVMCVNWLKNINCANLMKNHWTIETDFLLSRHYSYSVTTLFLFVATKIGVAF